MRKLKPNEELVLEYLSQNRHLISTVRKNLEQAFFNLKNVKRVINGFDFRHDRVSIVKQRIAMYTSMRLSYGYAKKMDIQRLEIVFFTSFQKKEVIAEPFFDRKIGQMRVDLNFDMPPALISENIERAITRHGFGFEAEKLFYHRFLLPFAKRFRSVRYIHYAGLQKDLKKGVDFVIGYCPKYLDSPFEIQFQLKTSGNFIQDHKTKYPNVSLFVCHPKMLDDTPTLSGRFLGFLNGHLRTRVVVPH